MLEKNYHLHSKNFMSCILGLLLASPVMAQDKPEIKLVEHCVTIIICLLERRSENEVEILDNVFRVNAKGAYKGIL
jgi:hypothetical protein